MIRRFINQTRQLLQVPAAINNLRNELIQINNGLDHQKILIGKQLSGFNMQRTEEILQDIHLAEFRVFSQWGDDGIIQFLVNYLDIEKKVFIEFGVENYKEANTRFLLVNNNWSGLVMDGSKENIENLKNEEIYWRYDLTALNHFITKENINSIIDDNGFSGQIGILHIDIDGNDYWILKEIQNVSPVILIVEFNSVFGYDTPWTIPYDKDFYRTHYHYSNLYWGSSLLSLCDLADEKGYYFVGCNSNGNNAYFVRKDKIKGMKPLSVEQGYIQSKYRESRGPDGNLTFLSGNDRLKEIKDLEIYNTRTEKIEKI
jgi:hypothetical protein